MRLYANKPNLLTNTKGQGQSVDSRGSEAAKKRYCTGYNPPCYVFIDVCKWHISESDVNCANCQHLSRKEKELLMDSYLNAAIGELNSEGCRYYDTGDPQARRERIYKLEKRITEAFLIGDVGGL